MEDRGGVLLEDLVLRAGDADALLLGSFAAGDDARRLGDGEARAGDGDARLVEEILEAGEGDLLVAGERATLGTGERVVRAGDWRLFGVCLAAAGEVDLLLVLVRLFLFGVACREGDFPVKAGGSR